MRDAGLYVSEVAIDEAVGTRGLFNAIDGTTGSRIDVIILESRAFSREIDASNRGA